MAVFVLDGSYSPQRSAVPQEQTSHFRVPHDQLQYVAVDDDFLGRKETEEFEEVCLFRTIVTLIIFDYKVSDVIFVFVFLR